MKHKEHCSHIYCGICIKKGRKQALEEVEKIIDETILKKLKELDFFKVITTNIITNIVDKELKPKIKELNK